LSPLSLSSDKYLLPTINFSVRRSQKSKVKLNLVEKNEIFFCESASLKKLLKWNQWCEAFLIGSIINAETISSSSCLGSRASRNGQAPIRLFLGRIQKLTFKCQQILIAFMKKRALPVKTEPYQCETGPYQCETGPYQYETDINH
jgi:hypothetical protein